MTNEYDQLINFLESVISFCEKNELKDASHKAHKIALAALQAHKQGLRMCRYLGCGECEETYTDLDKILETLE